MTEAVPVVDVEPFRAGSSAAGRAVTVAAVRRACEELGVLLVVGPESPAATSSIHQPAPVVAA